MLGNYHFWNINLLLIEMGMVIGGPIRHGGGTKNDVDSVVFAGGEKAVFIDTSTSFRVERLDTPIERIEIRLMDENSTQPVIIDIQKAAAQSTAVSSAEMSSNSVLEPGAARSEKDSDDKRKSESSLGGFELKVERKVEHFVPRSANRRWESRSQPEYVDDLPPLDIDDEDEAPLEVLPVERCYLNRDKLSPEILSDMDVDKRNLSRVLRQYNTQLRAYCSPEHEARDEAFRNCPLWREEKMIHYYKLMRLLYCSDYNLWPNAPKIKRSFGANLQLFEKLYAFMPRP